MKILNLVPKSILICISILIFDLSYGQERKEVGNMILEDVPDIPEEIKSRLQQYQNTRSASFADWMPNDEGLLISTRFGNTNQLHIVNNPDGIRSQITFFDEPVGDGLFCPSEDHNGFIFSKDVGGNEFSQLYWYDMNSRKSEMISDGSSVNFGVLWSNKGDKFAFTSTRRNKKDFDIYVSDISRSNELRQINDHQKEAVFMAVAWDRTGNKIYAITDEGKEFNTLVAYDIEQKKYKYITDNIPWDIVEFATNKNNTRAVFTANENGFSQLYSMDLESMEYQKVPNLPVGQITSLKFHPERDEIGMVLNTTESSGDVYSLDIKTKQSTRWTTSEVGGLNTSLFPKPELISFETYDELKGEKRQIPAFIYKPKKKDAKLPVIISIHGGPESQHVPNFSSVNAYLANELGIAVIAPNVRGSSGYGKSYLKLDDGFNRENSVQDIGKLIEWIKKNPDYDEDKIAVTGGSYGGYMVLSSMVNFNDQLRCGIDIVGISNFVTFLENTEAYRRDARRAEYGDERDPEMRAYLESISPANHAKEINKPLFVIQGANDPRVPASESEQMVKSIRENGGTVWYMLAKDEGHGFRKKENRDRMTEAIALFLKENLLDK